MMTQTNLKISENCIKDLDSITKQVILFRNNKKGDLPEKLLARVAYIRGYLTAIREVERLEREGKLKNVCQRLNDEYRPRFSKH